MKRFIQLSIFITALFAVSSCEDALEPKIYSQLTSENFPKSENDINGVLTSMYAVLGTAFQPEGFNPAYNTLWSYYHLNCATTDEMYDVWNAEYRLSWGSAFNTYELVYKNIKIVSRATDLLNLLENATVSESFKKSAVAQTRALRGWFMYMLYDWYGPVSVKLDPTELSERTFEERPSKEEYFNAMVADLESSIPDLSEKTNGTADWGRVNQGLVRMLLLKLYMNDHQWSKAKTVGQELMSMGYSLMPSYRDIFSEEENNEVVWAAPSGPQMPNFYLYAALPGDCHLINGIEVDPGWEGRYMPQSFYDKYPAGDKRLETIAKTYTDTDGNIKDESNSSILSQGAIGLKYMLPLEVSKDGGFDIVAFRYADVLLSMAEIENELNGPATGLSYLKQVTDRAGITIPNEADDSYQNFKDFLLDERGRELYWEGWRRQDMIRFGKLIEWGVSEGLPAKDHMVLFPLPSNVIIEAKGVVKQNDGYDE